MKNTAVALLMITLTGGWNVALAQSYEAPGGDTAVTEPGGTEGRDANRNIREGIRDGELVGTPREGVAVERGGEGQAPRRARPEH